MNKKQIVTFVYLSLTGILAAALFLFTAPAVPAHAATVNVGCSVNELAAAIHTANAAPGATTLKLTRCTYTLTAVNNTNDLGPNGLPVIRNTLTINGNGATIARSTADGTPDMRVFYIHPKGVLTLNRLTLMNARTPDGSSTESNAFGGGAIYNAGTLTLNSVTLSHNAAGAGYTEPQFSMTYRRGGDGGNGGAIFNTNRLSLTQSRLIENAAGAAGSGSCVQEVCAGVGIAGVGGAIFNTGTLDINQTTFFNNSAGAGGFANFGGAGGNGGAVWNANQLTVEASTFVHNHAGDSGPGSFIQANKAGDGGAIFTNGIATFTNLTLSENRAGNNAEGPGGNGGGIANQGILDGFNLTLSKNAAGDGNPDDGVGGNLSNAGTFSLVNSIIAHSALGSNCNSALTDGGSNLDSDGSCGIGAATDPGLDPNGLQDNGGPTQTIALQLDSPAINAGTNAICNTAPVNALDQRGIARPQGKYCDIGAFELQTPDAPVLVSPPDAKQTRNTTVTLKWNAAARTTSYRVTVYQDSPAGKKVAAERVTETVFQTQPLARGHWYYWQIQACNKAGCTASPMKRFYVKPA